MEQQRAATGRAPGRRSSTASTRRQPARRRPVQRRPVRRPRRGDSKRRLLFVLALTMVAFLAISGRLIVDPAGTARKLAPLLGQPAKTVLGRLRSGAAWTYLARKIPVANGQAVAKLD